MDLRPGNYVMQPATGTTPARYLRVVGLDLVGKTITVKADHSEATGSYTPGELQACPVAVLQQYMGGLSFEDHSLLIKGPGEVYLIHAEGSALVLPHIRFVHQFQNLFRSLTGQELPFNIT